MDAVAAGKGIERIASLDDVHHPAQGGATGGRIWRGSGIERGGYVQVLARK
ncbi:MAG: hypothetical protein PVH50_04175 [Anaerolineae bacterium]|jgi:hypothetical protein